MKIDLLPKRFQVGAQEYKIKMVDKIDVLDNKYGLLDCTNNLIYIQNNLSWDKTRHTLRHEQVHVVLCALGLDELNQNEAFVDNFALILDQILETER